MDKDLQYEDTGGKGPNTDPEGGEFRSGSSLGVQGDIQAGAIEGEGGIAPNLAERRAKPETEEPTATTGNSGTWAGKQDVGPGFEGGVHADQGVRESYTRNDLPGHTPGEVRS